MENKKPLYIILTVSAVVVGLVALLLFTTSKIPVDAPWIKFLPTLHAMLNGTTSVLLILAIVFVKRGNIRLHKQMMSLSFILGAVFLLSYITYHSTQGSTIFGDVDGSGVLEDGERVLVGGWRTLYVLLLLSHIGFSILVVPFVLLAFYYALADNIQSHQKIVKYTWPIWFYVSVSGVFVYLMISPYYH